MATISIEDGIQGVETLLLSQSFEDILAAIDAERDDGIVLEPIRATEWEETVGEISTLPCALLIGDSEVDESLRDRIIQVNVKVILLVADKSKQHLTRRLYRYGSAMRQMFHGADSRTLGQRFISAKVRRIEYSPTFVDRQNVYSRDITADLELRMSGR